MKKGRIKAFSLVIILLFLFSIFVIAFEEDDVGLTIPEYIEKYTKEKTIVQKILSLFSTKQAILGQEWRCKFGENVNPCPSGTQPNYLGWVDVCSFGFVDDDSRTCFYDPFLCQYSWAQCIPEQPACIDECSSQGTSCNGFNKVDCIKRNDGCLDELNKGKRVGFCGVDCLSDSDCSSSQECNSNFKCVNKPIEPRCGDGSCNGGETKQTCSTDCGTLDPCEGVNPNDNNPCTTDSCVNGDIINSPKQCSGEQVCDSATGNCVDRPVDCTKTCPNDCEELDVNSCSCIEVPSCTKPDDLTQNQILVLAGGGAFIFLLLVVLMVFIVRRR